MRACANVCARARVCVCVRARPLSLSRACISLQSINSQARQYYSLLNGIEKSRARGTNCFRCSCACAGVSFVLLNCAFWCVKQGEKNLKNCHKCKTLAEYVI